MAEFSNAVVKILGNEGGESNHKHDKGGFSKYGISSRAYPHLNIETLTIEQAEEVYKKDYWNVLKGDRIYSQMVANYLMDIAVNMGVVRAIKMIQEVIGVKKDGIVGIITIGAINVHDENVIISELALKRIRKYRNICIKDKTQKVFFFGWIDRALKGIDSEKPYIES